MSEGLRTVFPRHQHHQAEQQSDHYPIQDVAPEAKDREPLRINPYMSNEDFFSWASKMWRQKYKSSEVVVVPHHNRLLRHVF